MKLDEEVDHRQSLDAVYQTVKKQLMAKEDELFKYGEILQDLTKNLMFYPYMLSIVDASQHARTLNLRPSG